MEAHEVLEQVKSGKMTVEEAEQFFKREPFEEMGYAKIDSHRKMRSGFAEVVFCQGKRMSFFLKSFREYTRMKARSWEPGRLWHSMSCCTRNYRRLPMTLFLIY